MRPLTREQARAPRRATEPLTLQEYSAPLLLAKPSAGLAIRLRESKATFHSAEAISAMVADMLVDEDGVRIFSPEDVPAFLEGISADSLNALVTKCAEMYAGKAAAPVPQTPSPSA